MKGVLLGMFALLVLAGCMGTSVVGKWTYSVFGQNFVLELKDDNSFSLGSSSTSIQAGTYKVEGDKVTLTPSAGGQTITLNLSEDGKKLSGSLGPMNVEFNKESK